MDLGEGDTRRGRGRRGGDLGVGEDPDFPVSTIRRAAKAATSSSSRPSRAREGAPITCSMRSRIACRASARTVFRMTS